VCDVPLFVPGKQHGAECSLLANIYFVLAHEM
jgi:hypothetical protein